MLTGNDYHLTDPLLVNFSGDSLTANFHIPIIDDQILERPESFNLQISVPQKSADIGILLGDLVTANVTIIDNDGKLVSSFLFNSCIFSLGFSVHLDDDVYVIEEHHLTLPITLIAERPALVEYDVMVHPVVTDSNATSLCVCLTLVLKYNDGSSMGHLGPILKVIPFLYPSYSGAK